MSAWAVTQTNRFKAAIVGAGVSDWYTILAETPVPLWTVQVHFEAWAWDHPEAFRKHSPIEFVQQVKTPVLLFHGDHDNMIPISQARGYFRALRHYNVPSSLVVFPREGHGVRETAHRIDSQLDPQSLGRSAFGPLRFRAVHGERKGDWQRLATLVRVPSLTGIRCPAASTKECTLSGSNLFLIDSVASDEGFSNNVSVPLGFVSSEISVPHPNGGQLYVKLRDNPAVASVLAPPVISRRSKSPGERRPAAEPSSN
jgi:hypothetical protein